MFFFSLHILDISLYLFLKSDEGLISLINTSPLNISILYHNYDMLQTKKEVVGLQQSHQLLLLLLYLI